MYNNSTPLHYAVTEKNNAFEFWKLIDYAAFYNDILSARFLSLFDWDSNKHNSTQSRTLEIAAKYASVKTLAAFSNLQLPLSSGTITFSNDKLALLESCDGEHNMPFSIAARRGTKIM